MSSLKPRNRKLIATLSLGVVAASALFGLFTKTAATSIPRSHALLGVPASKNGDTNILLLGLDSRRDANGANLPRKLLDYMHVGSSSSIGGYNTNTMILIHIPKDGKSAVAVSIPRDDYVSVPGLGFHKIKEAYGLAKYYGEIPLINKGVKNPTLEQTGRSIGRDKTIQTIQNLLGVPIDHYAEVNLVSFYDLANAIGGVQASIAHQARHARAGRAPRRRAGRAPCRRLNWPATPNAAARSHNPRRTIRARGQRLTVQQRQRTGSRRNSACPDSLPHTCW